MQEKATSNVMGQAIAKRRRELNMTAEELAKRLGKSRATIYRYESGRGGSLSAKALLPLAVALKTTPAALLGLDEAKNDLTADERLLLKKYGELDGEGKSAVQAYVDELWQRQATADEIKSARVWEPKLTERDLLRVEKDFEAMRMASAAYMEDVEDKEAFAAAIKGVMLDAKLKAKKTYTPKKYRRRGNDDA